MAKETSNGIHTVKLCNHVQPGREIHQLADYKDGEHEHGRLSDRPKAEGMTDLRAGPDRRRRTGPLISVRRPGITTGGLMVGRIGRRELAIPKASQQAEWRPDY